ncbi:hypothetical protein Cni_G04664 [Canna indica]|uniref:DUF4283 domain-containing protein n=1 Tax=Canna indica TaxID=4628 RepID=A0AAQ3JVT3_9LILI|nr:hypothetical protein Cni_G04664 [Canna indica]
MSRSPFPKATLSPPPSLRPPPQPPDHPNVYDPPAASKTLSVVTKTSSSQRKECISSKPLSWAQILKSSNPNHLIGASKSPAATLSKIQASTTDRITFSAEQAQALRESWQCSLIGKFLGPWSFRGDVLRLIPWKPLFRPWDELFTTTPIWIRLLSLPLEFWNADFIATIVGSFGKLFRIDDRSFEYVRGRYVRACVEINLALPLRQGIWIDINVYIPCVSNAELLAIEKIRVRV